MPRDSGFGIGIGIGFVLQVCLMVVAETTALFFLLIGLYIYGYIVWHDYSAGQTKLNKSSNEKRQRDHRRTDDNDNIHKWQSFV